MDIAGVPEALRREPLSIRLAAGWSIRVKHPEFVAPGARGVILVAEDNSWSVVEPLLIVSVDYDSGSGKAKPRRRRRPGS